MATNWTIETKTKSSTTDNWTVFDIGNIAIGPVWEAMDSSTEERWEDLTDHYWGWTKSWTFSGKAVTRDSD